MLLCTDALAQDRPAPPPPYTGLGMEWQLKKGKFFLTGLSPHSPLQGQIPEKSLKKTWIASVQNRTTGKKYIQSAGNAVDMLLAASIGPMNSICDVELVLPGKNQRKSITAELNFVVDPTSGQRIAPGSAAEKRYTETHYPYNYVAYQILPNTDGDSLPDINDKCADQYGFIYLGGCPGDKDADGVYDDVDACPDEAGSAENGGCPAGDLDMDGIPDLNDECPYIPGWMPRRGCDMLPDTADLTDNDNDQTPDVADVCPAAWGPLHNKGCPANTPVNLPVQFWNSALRLMLAFTVEEETEKLRGEWIEKNADSASIYRLNQPVAGIAPDRTWFVTESSGTNRIAMDFGYTYRYRDALNYYSSLATAMYGHEFRDSIFATVLSFSQDILLYTPDLPMIQFTPAVYAEEDVTAIEETDEDRLKMVEEYVLVSLSVVELADESGKPYYAVRMWLN